MEAFIKAWKPKRLRPTIGNKRLGMTLFNSDPRRANDSEAKLSCKQQKKQMQQNVTIDDSVDMKTSMLSRNFVREALFSNVEDPAKTYH